MINTEEIKTVSQIQRLLSATEDLSMEFDSRGALYDAVRGILTRTKYHKLPKKQKKSVIKFLEKTTGYCRQQVKRLIAKHKKGQLFWKKWQANSFGKIYTNYDIALLHEIDKVHKGLAGPATKKILEAELASGKKQYAVISNISPAHIYNIRASTAYTRLGITFDKTKPVSCPIGIRKKPRPFGRPGYLRVDTVHQGDKDGKKGVYWINIVDEVTQYEFVFCVPQITQKYVIRILDLLFWMCPFEIINFHSDNGSEYINQFVARVLNKRNVFQTKSRARKSNDNALVESKNGSIIRKHFGRNYIPATEVNANLLTQFCIDWFVPYLNYYRPCAFPSETTDSRGKIKKKYKLDDYKTPYEKLKSLPKANSYLKKEVGFAELDKIAESSSPTDFAVQMNLNKDIIFRQIFS